MNKAEAMYEYSRANVKSKLRLAQLLRLRSYVAFILFNCGGKFDVIVEIHPKGIVLFLTFFLPMVSCLLLVSVLREPSSRSSLKVPCAISLPLKAI